MLLSFAFVFIGRIMFEKILRMLTARVLLKSDGLNLLRSSF